MSIHPEEANKVQGIKDALALVKHEPAEIGFCSLRTVGFDPEGRATVSILDLSHDEADKLYRSLGLVLGT